MNHSHWTKRGGMVLAALVALQGCTVGRSVLGGPSEEDGSTDIVVPDASDSATDTLRPDTTPGCTSDTQCRPDQFCDPMTNACAPGCSRDEACSGETPRCNVMSHTCVACVRDDHCPSGNVCRGNRCVMGCSPTQGCPMDQTCCTDACIDLRANTANCGMCGTQCMVPNAEPTCTMGRCAVGRCSGNFGDCDMDVRNGCETNTQDSLTHCGRCGNLCPTPPNAVPVCTTGTCGFTCSPGFADCNNNAADGCEVDLRVSGENCGRCANRCMAANGTSACAMGVCTVGACAPGFGDCNMDATDGCETNTQTSVMNCGMCGRGCMSIANATAGCTAGVCGIALCAAGFADCNMLPADGCEVNTQTTAAHCGACGRTCNLANATSDCSGGACRLVSCNPGFADCDGSPANGCEVNLNASIDHCGRCGNLCPMPMGGAPACNAGVCGVGTCARPLADCNMNPADGCEVNTDTNTTHCGSCNNACPRPANATASCVSGACGLGACNAGFANCDGNAANGCETNVQSDPRNCGACGRLCASLPNASSGCTTGVCGIGTCAPGFADCNAAVVDGCEVNLSTSAMHCGACARACATGQSCVGAACVCPPGQLLCGGRCVTTASDSANCGACGRVCTAGQSCVAGTCQCPVGSTLCGGACVALQTDARNCGACGRVCATDQACVMGVCIGQGQLRFTATWSLAGDIDLHLVPPCGTEIYYANRTACGGTLDNDDTTGTGPENIFWTTGATAGNYHICAAPFRINGPTTVTVTVVRGAMAPRTFTRTFTVSTGNETCSPTASSFMGTYVF